MARAAGLPPTRRIRRRSEFQHVFDTGRRLHGRLLTIVAAPAKGPDSRLGIVASRKIGGAVVRNRAKRLIREVFRAEDVPGAPLDLVVIPRPTLPAATLAIVAQDYRAALKRVGASKK
jgi:ribonuclease P protein component